MPKYVVRETVCYEVEAESAEEAIAHVTEDAGGEGGGHCFVAVYGRRAWTGDTIWCSDGPEPGRGATDITEDSS